MALNTTSELIEDIRNGRMVILMDDEDRENEGDLVIAASAVESDDINFMARFGRGLICLTLTGEHCRRLNLPLMTSHSSSNFSTNFTVSIEAAEGVTTGISAADRAMTIKKAVAPDAKPSDLVQPGHVFPLMAQPGGVLSRAGHTEAGCDLARLAGLQASAVIVEILNDDGSMARRPDLEKFAKHMNFPIIPCDLCGSQDGLQRQQMKALLKEWEDKRPGTKEVMMKALADIRPSQLLDKALFDFKDLIPK